MIGKAGICLKKTTKQPDREFSAYVRGDHPAQKSFGRYVLAQLRCARRRAQLLVMEIDAIGMALSSGAIDAETALEDLASAQALDFLLPEEPLYERIDDANPSGSADSRSEA